MLERHERSRTSTSQWKFIAQKLSLRPLKSNWKTQDLGWISSKSKTESDSLNSKCTCSRGSKKTDDINSN